MSQLVLIPVLVIILTPSVLPYANRTIESLADLNLRIPLRKLFQLSSSLNSIQPRDPILDPEFRVRLRQLQVIQSPCEQNHFALQPLNIRLLVDGGAAFVAEVES